MLKIYMELLATGNSHFSLEVLYGDVAISEDEQNHWITHLTKSSDMLNKNT